MCLFCSQNAWKTNFFFRWESQICEIILIVPACRSISFSYTFFEELNLFSIKNFLFFLRNVHFSMISISRIYQKRLPNFFSGERRLNWSDQLNVFEPTSRKLTGVNRCLVFQFFGFKISLYGASFQQNTAIVFHCNFLFCVFCQFFFDSFSLNWCFSILLRHFGVTGVH